LVVIVMGDEVVRRKKGYCLLPVEDRLRIVAAIGGVDHVVAWDDGTQTVDGMLSLLRPKFFTKGGDRSSPQAMAPEELAICSQIGCKILYGVGGYNKAQSSSDLVLKAFEHFKKSHHA
jgi:bifunctional ADP-heptose synthase (sugar kinase/adenylyltransferase)